MTKLLVWNIERFSDSKINKLSTKYVTAAGQVNRKYLTESDHADIRLNHILDNLLSNVPDMFAIIEVSQGSLAPALPLPLGYGEQGCITLLRAINANLILSPGGGDWKIVPPLLTGTGGKREAVAVYYKPAVVTFEGPNRWTKKGSVPYVKGLKTSLYKAPWRKASNNTNRAAQIDFQDATGKALGFPTAAHRAPYYTVFKETGGMMRTIHFFAIHTTPVDAVAGTAEIAKIKEIINFAAVGGLGFNEVVVIAGDFNVSQSLPPAKILSSYGALMKLGYQPAFVGPGPESITHLKPLTTYTEEDPNWDAQPFTRTAADPWKFSPKRRFTPGFKGPIKPLVNEYYQEYPGYGYLSYSPSDTLDNIFTLYGAKAGAGPKQTMIVNRIVGAPYFNTKNFTKGVGAAVPALPGPMKAWGPPPAPPPAPKGGFTYQSAMATSIPTLGNAKKPQGQVNSFRGHDNYGKIRLTSDHMAVYIQI